jgi:hypothetical protein
MTTSASSDFSFDLTYLLSDTATLKPKQSKKKSASAYQNQIFEQQNSLNSEDPPSFLVLQEDDKLESYS